MLFRSQVTLVAGTAAVPDTGIKSTSSVVVTPNSSLAQHLSVSITPGVKFTINSTSNTDTRVVNYVVHY